MSAIFSSPELARYVAGWLGSFTKGLRLHLPTGIGPRDTNAAKMRMAYMAARALTIALQAEFPEFRAEVYETNARALADALRDLKRERGRIIQ